MTWHAYRTIGGREFSSQRAVESLGGTAVVPPEYRHVRSRGRHGQPILRSVPRPLIPGYVFVRWGGGTPWAALRLIPSLRGVVMRDGEPAIFGDDDVRALQLMAASASHQPGGGYRRGDAVRARVGVYAGWEGRVAEIRGALITMEVAAFGGVHAVTIPVARVERVG